MSKIEAYQCDFCNQIKDADLISGVKPDADCFNKIDGLKTEKAAKCEIHFCISCYREQVIEPAERSSNRSTDEYEYKLMIRTLSFEFKQTCYLRRYNRLRDKTA